MGFFRFLAWSVVLVGLLIAGLRTTAIRWWQLPQDDAELAASVRPTLDGGDWLLLWRVTRPGRGDLVVCPDPDDPSNVVIGRIAALEGDFVELRGQGVVLNDKAPTLEYNCTERRYSFSDPDTRQSRNGSCNMEELGGKLHMRGVSLDVRREPRSYKNRIPEGHIFLLSDNRAAPFDSRHFGTLERSRCKETIFFRLVGPRGYSDAESRLSYIR